MVIPYLKNRPMITSVIVSGIVALVAYPVPHQMGLMIAALAGIVTGVVVEYWQPSKESNNRTTL